MLLMFAYSVVFSITKLYIAFYRPKAKPKPKAAKPVLLQFRGAPPIAHLLGLGIGLGIGLWLGIRLGLRLGLRCLCAVGDN